MNAYTEKYDWKYSIAVRMHGNSCTHAQCNAIKKAAEEDLPFPIKPVSHKRLPRTQDRLGLQQFEEPTLSSQPRGRLMPLEYPLGGIRETPTSFHSQKFSQKWQSKELQMSRAIQEKEILLQEKLWRLGENLRQTIQIRSADTAAGYGIRNKQDLQQARWDPNEHTNSLQRNLRLEKLNEPFRKREVEKDYGTWKETEARTYREQNEATVGNVTLTREKKYKERTQRDNNGLDNQQNVSQKRVHRLATENQKGTRENQPNELTLPLLSGSFHRSQQQQSGPSISNTQGGSFQLLPCELCNRIFLSDRLEKHIRICAKVHQKQREVFDSSAQRYKGTYAEKYFETRQRTKTPEALKRNTRQNRKRNM